MPKYDKTVLTEQARRFLLLRHGLAGEHKFVGKQGILDFIEMAGCIQYDPIDVCGKNPELVLQSRVKNFTKDTLYSLLYEERKLIDYFDKNLSIYKVDDWTYFGRTREWYSANSRSRDEVNKVREQIKKIIKEKGAVRSQDLDELSGKVSWYWGDTKLSRVALETMYFTGELVVHHKKGTNKYYDSAENLISQKFLNAAEPLPDAIDHLTWRVKRRIGAVGLLWKKPSDAWLGIGELKAAERNAVFEHLIKSGEITPVRVDGIKDTLYCLTSEIPLLDEAAELSSIEKRCEFIAPLDNLMWDRKIIKAIFDFDYKWEIYTPQKQRKYGYYTLPVLYGDNFVGRMEAVCDRKNKALMFKNFWAEDGVKIGLDKSGAFKRAFEKRLKAFAEFNDCASVKGYVK
ncbi:MAG: winged helix DNA-binding domain-containing protein [Oscillospiraceae bacterium]|nr:winged helix DNA-binding domain-containing protein [Oscillospiraceae bacterium]